MRERERINRLKNLSAVVLERCSLCILCSLKIPPKFKCNPSSSLIPLCWFFLSISSKIEGKIWMEDWLNLLWKKTSPSERVRKAGIFCFDYKISVCITKMPLSFLLLWENKNPLHMLSKYNKFCFRCISLSHILFFF